MRQECVYVEPTRQIPTLREDVMEGLFDEPRRLPPKYFYDDHGSRLFDQICNEPEYYPTRTEEVLLLQAAKRIIALTKPAEILELGSGTSRKTRRLLDACEELGIHPVYSPFDVCDEVVIDAATRLREEYAWLEVKPLIGDYTAGLGNVPWQFSPTLVTFLGGTIGNFEPRQAARFLNEIRQIMCADDWILLGADRVKDPRVLRAAYNDEAGTTAEFNLNVLEVLNRELGADFNLDAFSHQALYNDNAEQIEMYLISDEEQQVTFPSLDRNLDLAPGSKILTEVSRKFTETSLAQLLQDAGFEIDTHFEAEDYAFSLVLARPIVRPTN